MSWSRAGLYSLLLLSLFIIQESAVSKINLPITGFSLYLAVLLGLMAIEENFGGVVVGFIGGIILDFSPSADSPFGKWALVLTLVGYVCSLNSESIGDFTDRPASFVIFVSLGSIGTLITFLCFGVLLGENNGALGHNFVMVLGNAFWTLLFAPLLLPPAIKWRQLTLTSRERQ